eukprot:10443588-Prorocentrum_lima.AAC.1
MGPPLRLRFMPRYVFQAKIGRHLGASFVFKYEPKRSAALVVMTNMDSPAWSLRIHPLVNPQHK